MNTNLVLCYINECVYKVYYENEVYIGDFVVGDDGYYAYWPEHHGGCLDSWHLFDIHQNLEELNKEWNDKINNDIASLHN